MKRWLSMMMILVMSTSAFAVDFWMDVDTAIAACPVNLMPLLASADGITIDADVNYNVAGLALIWNFVTSAGAYTQTAVTPTDTGGVYDWIEQGNGMFTIEIPASGGGTINNNTEGYGWFTGVATGICPWRGPVVGFRSANKNDLEVDDTTAGTNQDDFFDGTGYVGGTAKLTVDASKINGVATTSVTTINANIGTTQPVNYTGTGATAYVKTDSILVDSGAPADSTTWAAATQTGMTAQGATTTRMAYLDELGPDNLPADVDTSYDWLVKIFASLP